MKLKTLLSDVSPRGVVTITLNRPEKGNAFDRQMVRELALQFLRLAKDATVRVVVLRASGRYFCVGADIGGTSRKPDDGAKPEFELIDALKAIDTLPKPTIAVVEGGCVGGGLAIAACCDVLIATDSAFFSIPEVRVGIVPTLAPLFVRAIGHRAFRRYGATGERLSARDGLRLGLVHQICDPATLDAELANILDAIFQGAPGALRKMKAMVAQYAAPGPAAVFPAKRRRPGFNDRSDEAREGIAAFREKRKPSWYRAGDK